MSCGADTEANALIESLTAGEDFTIPEIDWDDEAFKFPGGTDGPLYQPVQRITIEELTTRTVGGSGVFDALMASFSAHLRAEYEKSRITGDDYTKTYIALSESAMANATQFLLGKDESFWNAQTAQLQAFTARVGLETAKAEMANTQLQALNQRANFAKTKLQLSTESISYCISKYNLDTMMPQQLSMLTKQIEGQVATNSTATYNLSTMLPQQLINLKGQEVMIKEQMEAQRGQTADTRTDGIPVSGVMGKQKDLYTQQITSYKRDSEIKGAKLFTDAWITMKSIDEGLLPPNGFANASIDTVLTAIKTNNELN